MAWAVVECELFDGRIFILFSAISPVPLHGVWECAESVNEPTHAYSLAQSVDLLSKFLLRSKEKHVHQCSKELTLVEPGCPTQALCVQVVLFPEAALDEGWGPMNPETA